MPPAGCSITTGKGLKTTFRTKPASFPTPHDKIILYDLTNTYFEGRKLHSHLAMFGNSKEKRKDARLAT